MDPENGLACWQKLVQHYDPTGGDNDIDRLNSFFSWPRAKKLADVEQTVESWEKAMKEYTDRVGESFPNRFKVNLLLRMLPVEHETYRVVHAHGTSVT